jgi:hypothetical protein
MVIDRITTRAFSHLFRAHADRIDVRPPTFWVFQVTCGRPTEEVEGEVKLTRFTVIVYMKLGQNTLRIADAVRIDLHEGRELTHPLQDIPCPLTADVVREHKCQHERAEEGREDHEIHICEAETSY